MTKPPAAAASPHVQLTTDGVAVVRGFLNGDQTTALRHLVASVYDAMATCSEFSNPEMAENFKRWNGVWLRPLPDFLNGHDTLTAQYRASVATVARRTRMLFGGGWRYYPLRSYFRKYTGAEELVPWHIDADAARVDRPDAINVWLPLDAVGAGLPSLEMVVGSHDKMRQLPLLTGSGAIAMMPSLRQPEQKSFPNSIQETPLSSTISRCTGRSRRSATYSNERHANSVSSNCRAGAEFLR